MLADVKSPNIVHKLYPSILRAFELLRVFKMRPYKQGYCSFLHTNSQGCLLISLTNTNSK